MPDRMFDSNSLILAGGFGMRLGDFGENTPKGLIKLPNGETLLGKLIADLEKTTGDKLMGDRLQAP